MATGRRDDRAHHFGGSRVLADMRVTAERTIEDLYREQALGLLRFALLTCSLPPGGVQTWMICVQ